MAKVQRIARAAHWGDLFAGDPFEQHLARVASTVADLTTRTAPREAAWLYDVCRTGLSTEDLLRWGVAAATVRVIAALPHRVGEPIESYVDRLRHSAGPAVALGPECCCPAARPHRRTGRPGRPG